jgi:hypothetical protein
LCRPSGEPAKAPPSAIVYNLYAHHNEGSLTIQR